MAFGLGWGQSKAFGPGLGQPGLLLQVWDNLDYCWKMEKNAF